MNALDLGGVAVERDVVARTRDGVTLRADVYRPGTPGPHPVLLMRTPYGKAYGQMGVYRHPSWYARRGYVVVVQDVRGRGASDGEFEPFRYEGRDGADAVRWAAGLPDTTGRVGTYGFSYPGLSQLLAAAERPAELACMAVGCAGADPYEGWTYRGGALHRAFVLSWVLEALAPGEALRAGRPDALARVAAVAAQLRTAPELLEPARVAEELAGLELCPYLADWLAHPERDDYWRARVPDLGAIEVPGLHVGGWYDIFRDGTLAAFAATRATGARLVMGPWQHLPWSRLGGAVDFGPGADNPVDDLQLRWFDRWLKDAPGDDAEPVRFFVTGANEWRGAPAWPPASSVHELALRSGGGASSLGGDGRLEPDAAADEPPDVFAFDARDPAPSLGGASCCNPLTAPMGVFDQRGVEIRNDVLVYTSAPLAEALELAGPVAVVLHAATDALSADWTAKLVDVHPDERALNVTDGILRAESPDGEAREHRIELGAVGHRFGAGHRVRLELSAASFPAYDVNGEGISTRVVFHDEARPSRLLLP